MNFALFLLILLIVTGLVWAMEGVSLRRRREAAAFPIGMTFGGH